MDKWKDYYKKCEIFTGNFTKDEFFKLSSEELQEMFNKQFNTNLDRYEYMELELNFQFGCLNNDGIKYNFKKH